MLFQPIKTMAKFTDEVMVSYSGGKDSAVVLDLCHKHFKKLHVFFMYIVRDLSFQVSLMEWARDRYGVSILMLPHFILGSMYRYGTFRVEDYDVPVVDVSDTYAFLRNRFGCCWIAGGER